jgi:hypothetical protein
MFRKSILVKDSKSNEFGERQTFLNGLRFSQVNGAFDQLTMTHFAHEMTTSNARQGNAMQCHRARLST